MNDEEKRIEWDVPQPTLKEWLMVSRRVDGEPSLREHVYATPEDLRNACEAVGLVVEDAGVFDALVAKKSEEWRVLSERLSAELLILRSGNQWLDQSLLDQRNLALERSEKAETEVVTLRAERDVARENHNAVQPLVYKLERDVEVAQEQANALRSQLARAEATIRQTNVELLTADNATLRAQLAELSAEHRSMVAASLRELEVLRGQLAASEALLEATRQASQCAPKSADIPKMVADIVANRKAVCEHARALEAQLAVLTSSEGRATDEDLVEIWANAFDKEQSLATHVPGSGTARLAAARAVAAKVRRERPACLVERLVAKGYDFRAEEVPGSALGHWKVLVQGPGPIVRERSCVAVAADVPATLARLAGLEVK